MSSFDLTPLFRSTIGFDQLRRMIDASFDSEDSLAYPPYNIEKTSENGYKITMAVAGFGQGDISVNVHQNVLTISGKVRSKMPETQFLHRGIATRAFERRFQLADYVEVRGASLDNGLLQIQLEREVPESAKPRSIPVTAAKTVSGTSSEASELQLADNRTEKVAQR